MTDRVTLFVDYQNAYMAAREQFTPVNGSIDYRFGQFNPRALGELITARRPLDRDSTLVSVRVYRGMPDASKDPKGYGACRAQIAAWRRDSSVIVTTRPLRYPRGWPHHSVGGERPQEKGIDVELALDYVTMALDGAFDVGVLMTLDTDLKPALEFVKRRQRAWVEVAAWSGEGVRSRRLALPGENVWCHWLDGRDYESVRDDTDYVSG